MPLNIKLRLGSFDGPFAKDFVIRAVDPSGKEIFIRSTVKAILRKIVAQMTLLTITGFREQDTITASGRIKLLRMLSGPTESHVKSATNLPPGLHVATEPDGQDSNYFYYKLLVTYLKSEDKFDLWKKHITQIDLSLDSGKIIPAELSVLLDIVDGIRVDPPTIRISGSDPGGSKCIVSLTAPEKSIVEPVECSCEANDVMVDFQKSPRSGNFAILNICFRKDIDYSKKGVSRTSVHIKLRIDGQIHESEIPIIVTR